MNSIYNRIANNLTSFFIKKSTISNDDREMYAYGFEVLISSVVYTIIFILVSVITKTILPSLCFFIGFYLIRSSSGGFHANTYTLCHILYFINHIVFIITFKTIPSVATNLLAGGLFIVSATLVLAYGPVDHPNKPFINNEEARFRKRCIISGIVLIALSSISFIISNVLILKQLFCISIGSFSAAISLTIARIQKERRVKHEKV